MDILTIKILECDGLLVLQYILTEEYAEQIRLAGYDVRSYESKPRRECTCIDPALFCRSCCACTAITTK